MSDPGLAASAGPVSRPADSIEATKDKDNQWRELWTDPDPTSLEWVRMRDGAEVLSSSIPVDHSRRSTLGPLVGSLDLRTRPIHRWFTFKEAFSPDLVGTLIDELDLEGPLKVLDVFGGVATTALAGQFDPRISSVISVEYSPIAHFVGETKLSWTELDPGRLAVLLDSALAYDRTCGGALPALSSFHNDRIFHPQTVRSLVNAREHVRGLELSTAERKFFLLGIAAVVEDLSGAMKDGRALRIKGSRSRRPSSLAATPSRTRAKGRVKRALAGQWSAMIDDVEMLANHANTASQTECRHVRGDARCLRTAEGGELVPDGWADFSCFSPPYLNCLDYTELYKLELWLLEFVTTQAEFRAVRKGTLRSHPSIRFETRPVGDRTPGAVLEHSELLSKWMAENSTRPEVARPLIEYFEDMLEVWKQQARVVKRGGVATCVVANSTFSRRSREEGGLLVEDWKFPVFTDSLLARLALEAGFERTEIWAARDLRARNARSTNSRESVVVAWR